jgi:hypothetical protein
MNKSLLERTLKAMIESRDDVASTISEIPPWKADYEHRLAMATEQLAEHDACIKDLKAAIAEQAKPQEPMAEEEIRMAIGRGWAHEKNAYKVMDVDLSLAIADEVKKALLAKYNIGVNK